MSTDILPTHPLHRHRHPGLADDADADDDIAGWQVLAQATHGRRLTDGEIASIRRLPARHALDLLFPHLTDAARHEALWALG